MCWPCAATSRPTVLTEHGQPKSPRRSGSVPAPALAPPEYWGPGEEPALGYAWARASLARLPEPGWGHWLLVRLGLENPTYLACYVCFGPAITTLAELVQVAGTRWAIEETVSSAKGEVGSTITRSGTTPPGIGTSPDHARAGIPGRDSRRGDASPSSTGGH